MKQELKELLERKYTPEKVEELAEIMSQGRWTHDYPITYDEAKRLGLPVRTDMPTEIYQLMNLFPQPLRQHPSVMFDPTPKRANHQGWPNQQP